MVPGLIFKDPLLDFTIGVKGAVIIYVVAGRIQENRHGRTKMFDPLQLETAHLDHRTVRILAAGQETYERIADIASHEYLFPRSLHYVSYQGGCRRLAVAAGYGNYGTGQKAIGKFNFAYDPYPPHSGFFKDRIERRNAGRRHDKEIGRAHL